MAWGIAADIVLVLHLCFVLFVVAGGLLVARWPFLVWLHAPAFLWGAVVTLMGWPCPLTPLEVWLRIQAGQQGYTGGFIEHYLLGLLYPQGLTRIQQIVLGGAVLVINGGVYRVLWKNRRHGRDG